MEDIRNEQTDVNSDEYTQDRIAAAEDKLRLQQEQAKTQFTVAGEESPKVDIPAPEDRDLSEFRGADAEAYKSQVAVASDDYEPVGFEDFKGQVFNSPDINPDAKEFQLKSPDEHTGPDAHAEAVRTGVNPRTAATASDREGVEQPSDQVEPVSEIAEPVETAETPTPETPSVED
jgi:hypothetical protein